MRLNPFEAGTLKRELQPARFAALVGIQPSGCAAVPIERRSMAKLKNLFLSLALYAF